MRQFGGQKMNVRNDPSSGDYTCEVREVFRIGFHAVGERGMGG